MERRRADYGYGKVAVRVAAAACAVSGGGILLPAMRQMHTQTVTEKSAPHRRPRRWQGRVADPFSACNGTNTINKGIVVNADYILTFEDNCCIMENGIQFPVRVRDFLKIEQTVRKYHFMKIRERQSLSKMARARGRSVFSV